MLDKIITKMPTNQLSRVASVVISLTQSDIMPKQLITNNILVARKLLNALNIEDGVVNNLRQINKIGYVLYLK